MLIQDSLSPEKMAVRALIEKLCNGGRPSGDTLARELCVTPYMGNYGPAGLVIAVNGSPPRGIILTEGNFAAFMAAGGRAREIKKDDQREIIWRFVAWHRKIQALASQIDSARALSLIDSHGYPRTVVTIADELQTDPASAANALGEVIGWSPLLAGATMSITRDGNGRVVAGVNLSTP